MKISEKYMHEYVCCLPHALEVHILCAVWESVSKLALSDVEKWQALCDARSSKVCDLTDTIDITFVLNTRRKVLFSDKDNAFELIITDASPDELDAYFRYRNHMILEGSRFEKFAPLKACCYVKELLDSEIDEFEDVDIIGYDEAYCYEDYSLDDGRRVIKISTSMTSEYELIRTDAPSHVIRASLACIMADEEEGNDIDNPYWIIEKFGYSVDVLGSQDDFDSEHTIQVDEEFDIYNLWG